MKIKSKILIIAGSDSSGGAGIQADIKTVTSLGSYAMTAITAVTSQNTTGVLSIIPIPAIEISRQIEFTSKDIKPDAIKIGMLHTSPVINSVIKSLNKIKIKKIVLDPVMIAKGGAKLIDDKSVQILKKKLLKRVSLITPNIPEAEILTQTKIESTRGVSHLVKFGQELAEVPKQVVVFLKTKVDENDICTQKITWREFQTGEKLVIKKGILVGKEAIFLSKQSRERVKLLLRLLNQQITAELPASDIEKKEITETFKL